MAVHKIYAGASLRETRARHGLTQRVFADRLGVSLPYLSQMENNHRPVSAGVLLRLASEFGVDIGTMAAGDTDRMVIDMAEALADPLFDAAPPLADLRLAAANAPALARAFLDLYRAHRDGQERLAALDESLGATGGNAFTSPWEEVRDFFHYCDNYIDAVDRAAERFACPGGDRAPAMDRARAGLAQAGLRVNTAALPPGAVFRRDGTTVTLNAAAEPATQAFQLLHLVALETRADLLDATLDLARFRSRTARDIARIGLANYFAGAALLPYRPFLAAAREDRHDLERLAQRFGASLEQVAHRLSTLQRPADKGVPFFFVRVDQAGTITKRHSATRLQFARFGGRLPAVERASGLRNPGPVPAPAGPDARRRALSVARARGGQAGRRVSRPGPALCHRAGVRGQPRARHGLCRRSGPGQSAGLRADRDQLPHLPAGRLPPAVRPAHRPRRGDRPRPTRPPALSHPLIGGLLPIADGMLRGPRVPRDGCAGHAVTSRQ